MEIVYFDIKIAKDDDSGRRFSEKALREILAGKNAVEVLMEGFKYQMIKGEQVGETTFEILSDLIGSYDMVVLTTPGGAVYKYKDGEFLPDQSDESLDLDPEVKAIVEDAGVTHIAKSIGLLSPGLISVIEALKDLDYSKLEKVEHVLGYASIALRDAQYYTNLIRYRDAKDIDMYTNELDKYYTSFDKAIKGLEKAVNESVSEAKPVAKDDECPICYTHDIDKYEFTADGNTAVCKCSCNNCNSTFDFNYNLQFTGMSNVVDNSKG